MQEVIFNFCAMGGMLRQEWTVAAPSERMVRVCREGMTNRAIPALGRALRPPAPNLAGVFSYRLLHDCLTEGCAIASMNFIRIYHSWHQNNLVHSEVPKVYDQAPRVGWKESG